MPIIAVLLLAFKAWMLVDSIQRSGGGRGGMSSYWFLICWIPFGDWAYFFAVKIHDPEFARLWKRVLKKKTSLDELRYLYKSSGSAVNKLKLAQALHDAGKFDEATVLAEELLQSETGNKVYQYLSASCLMGAKRSNEARVRFEALLEKDFDFKNFEAAVNYAALCVDLDERKKAIEIYRRIVKSSSQLQYQIDLATLLSEEGAREEAKQILDDAILQFKHEPRFIQRRDQKQLGIAKKARKILEGAVRA